MKKRKILVLALVTLFSVPAFAESDAAGESLGSIMSLTQGLDTVWVLLGAFLVFFMQAGFGMGSTRAQPFLLVMVH